MRLMTRQMVRFGIGALLAAAAVGASPSAALAGRHGGYDRGDSDRGDVRIGFDLPSVIVLDHRDTIDCDPVATRVSVQPVYRTTCDRQWVPATYRTACERVWVEPATRIECVRVYVPACYEWRDVVRYEYGYRTVCRQRVLVSPAHYEEQRRAVAVTPGHYEEVQRQVLVCEGGWQNVERRELVTPGHWETRERIVERPVYDEHAGVRFELRLPIR